MCGLAGFVGGFEDGEALLSRMSSAVSHRGPDDCGTWVSEGVGLAHRRLAILDPSALGHQPMISDCGRYVVVHNGEIYNFLELRAELEARGARFSSTSDTEVLLAAFRQWGEDCVHRFNGMWAFAIWDRSERRLFASRDRFGKKPFYYHRHGTGLIFASEIKALLATGRLEAIPNPAVIADFAAERISDHTEQTFFRGVMQLPPGHLLCWREGELSIRRYWNLADAVGAADAEQPPDSEAAGLADLLRDAVRLRMRADTPVGVLLSGGLDSSAVTCLAAGLSAQPLHAFSTVDRQRPVAEAEGIEQVAQRYGNVVLHRDQPDANDFLDDLDACLWHQEEPFADGSMVAHFRLMRRARQHGVKVLLTGQGADEVFAGYPGYLDVHLASLAKRGRYAELLAFSRAMTAVGQPPSYRAVLGHLLPVGARMRLRDRRSRKTAGWLAPGFSEVSPKVRQGFDAGREDALNGALLDSIRMRTLPGFLHYEDRNSMAHGVETRLPFLDYRLVTRLFALPGDRKVRDGMTKTLLRDAVAPTVPAAIVQRAAKEGYPAPLGRWLRHAHATRQDDWVDAVDACPFVVREPWLDGYRQFLAGDEAGLASVWRGLILALWHRRFVTRSP
jgi:asparagine synthase (glutamine-hydrolysing)